MSFWRKRNPHLSDFDPVYSGFHAGIGGGDSPGLIFVRSLDNHHAINPFGIQNRSREETDALSYSPFK